MAHPESLIGIDEWTWFYRVGQAACILFSNGAGMLRPGVPHLRRKSVEGTADLWLEPWDDRKLRHEQCRKGVSAKLTREIRVYTGRKTIPPGIISDEYVSVEKTAGPWNAIVRQMAYEVEDAVIRSGGPTYVAEYSRSVEPFTRHLQRPAAPAQGVPPAPFTGRLARANDVVGAVGIHGRILDRPDR